MGYVSFMKNSLKGGVSDSMTIQSEDVLFKRFYDICPICKEKIIGRSKSHVIYNLRLHLESHSQKDSMKE